MDFISNTDVQLKEMLAVIGVEKVEDLFQDVESKLRLARPIVNDGISEYEGIRLMESLAALNTFPQFENYLGAGAYEHHIPAFVGSICSKSEFLTSYTPYQAEASQGLLQAIFEFQTAICSLTGMDVANASVYDGASACGEAVHMALRIHPSRKNIVIAGSLNPLYRAVVEQYISTQNIAIKSIEDPFDEQTAAVLIQSPNFFGIVEDIVTVVQTAHDVGALVILCANPLSYGLYPSAKEQGADIAVGDCQPLGLPLNYGGPYAGYMSCRSELLRQLPGRIVGETKDVKGRRGFTLTLQAREQHIRREKATSNICTNQALAALASLITILWYGPKGLQELALTNYQRTAYLKQGLSKVPGITLLHKGEHFNEFAIQFGKPLEKVLQDFHAAGIKPGIPLGRFYPEYNDALLVAVTETKSKEQLDRYIDIARG